MCISGRAGTSSINWDLIMLVFRVAANPLAQFSYCLCILISTCVVNVLFQPLVYFRNRLFYHSQFSSVIVTLGHGLTAN